MASDSDDRARELAALIRNRIDAAVKVADNRIELEIPNAADVARLLGECQTPTPDTAALTAEDESRIRKRTMRWLPMEKWGPKCAGCGADAAPHSLCN